MIRPYYLFLNTKCIFIIHLLLLFFSLNLLANYNNLITPKGFKADLYISDISAPRQMVEGNKFIFIGGIKGEIFAINKKNTEIRYTLASDLNNSRGIAISNGDLYFAEVDRIWVIKDIDNVMNSIDQKDPELILFNSNLPSDAWHGGKWIKFDSKGRLYANIGAPCNICLDGIEKDERYASIVRLEEGIWKTVARGVRNSVGF